MSYVYTFWGCHAKHKRCGVSPCQSHVRSRRALPTAPKKALVWKKMRCGKGGKDVPKNHEKWWILSSNMVINRAVEPEWGFVPWDDGRFHKGNQNRIGSWTDRIEVTNARVKMGDPQDHGFLNSSNFLSGGTPILRNLHVGSTSHEGTDQRRWVRKWLDLILNI